VRVLFYEVAAFLQNQISPRRIAQSETKNSQQLSLITTLHRVSLFDFLLQVLG